MKRKIIILFLLILPILFETKVLAEKPKISFYTTDRLSPHVTLIGDQMTGIIGDFIKESLNEVATIQIKVFPWPRAQKEVQQEKNAMIAPMGRTIERENKYKWLTKVFDDPVCVFTVKPNKAMNSIEDIKSLNKIGFTLGVGYLYKAKENGFSDKIITNYESQENAKQLSEGVINAWFSGTLVTKNQWKAQKLDVNLLQCGKVIINQQISIAASLNSDS
ncbi:MAG: hypothetical protein K2X69_05655, partial [Silvanigrellaceae bacterium]|nr:hypothetical protein [Silvanigrellaceae bacterium]